MNITSSPPPQHTYNKFMAVDSCIIYSLCLTIIFIASHIPDSSFTVAMAIKNRIIMYTQGEIKV